MHYDARKHKSHGLPHDPFKAIVAPRPIGWITSMSAAGEINLAPYSWFNGVSSAPPMVMFSSELRKDTLTFIEETKEFVCNFATWNLREQVNLSSTPFPRGVNEMEKCGLLPAPSQFVRPPRVAASPAALECRWLQTVSLADVDGHPTDRHVLFGQVIGVYVDDRFIVVAPANAPASWLAGWESKRPWPRPGGLFRWCACGDTQAERRCHAESKMISG
jgi:flavin reductase (DIM6/NTAB) family NADH-FMN oxidoreductase RutF